MERWGLFTLNAWSDMALGALYVILVSRGLKDAWSYGPLVAIVVFGGATSATRARGRRPEQWVES